ncbi:hypothetical protein NLI96_g2011 [Meripilus lineatus]|uniref:Uncharacterized protein n=1 Tax=Meripilus lineatus TaxID=2056292 RepID=A0AAD5VBL6_9APHY|nr:hypothetical protein NLI96_g2011 [Physisporinus lineatus]
MCGPSTQASEAFSFSESDIANAELLVPLEPESIIEKLTLRGVQPAHAALISHLVIQKETKIQQHYSCHIQAALTRIQRINIDPEAIRSCFLSQYENTFRQRLDIAAVRIRLRPRHEEVRSI